MIEFASDHAFFDFSLANKKTSKAKELDNSGFRVDGEPMNKPRKVRPQNTVSQISYHIKMSPV